MYFLYSARTTGNTKKPMSAGAGGQVKPRRLRLWVEGEEGEEVVAAAPVLELERMSHG
jgi:hypothetical protein